MRAAREATRRPFTFLALLPVLLLASSAVVGTAVPRPGIGVRLAPGSMSVQRGQQAVFTVTLTSTDGFAGALALSAEGLPAHTTAAFEPATMMLRPTGRGSAATSTLTVSTTTSTTLGAATFAVTARSGKTRASVAAGLTVSAAATGSLAMTTSPARVSMIPGATAVYGIALTRTELAGKVTFSVVGDLPTGATAAFSPDRTSGRSAQLEVSTSERTEPGSYPLRLRARGTDAAGTARTATSEVQLVLKRSGGRFTVTGDAGGLLSPGVTVPIDLTLSNPDRVPLSVTNLTVTIRSVLPRPGRSCTASDYAVSQYTGPYPLVLPGGSSRSLTRLGVSAQLWPKTTFVNRPVNQDGCRGARVELGYLGTGQGS